MACRTYTVVEMDPARGHSQISQATAATNLTKPCTEIGKKAWLFAKLQPGRARKIINAT